METETVLEVETGTGTKPEPTPVAFFFQCLRRALGFLSGNKLKMGGNSGREGGRSASATRVAGSAAVRVGLCRVGKTFG